MADQTIAARYVRTCMYCASQIDARDVNTYHRATCFIKNRKSGGNQGANAPCLINWHEEWACTFCIHKIMDGIPLGQMSIFEAGAYDTP